MSVIASQRELAPLWIPEPKWKGETAFIIGGGPSVIKQDLNLIRGRHVIAINTSYKVASWADYLIFSDDPWWRFNQPKISFSGHIVSVSAVSKGEKIWRRLERRKPPGMSDKPGTVTVNWTTMTAAIDLAAQLGATRIVTLGLDGKAIQTGKDTKGRPILLTHHHEPHKSSNCVRNFANQRNDLKSFVQPLKDRGIEVLNASPGSAIDLWPIINLQTVI